MWEWIAFAVLFIAFVVFMPWAVGAMRNSQRESGTGGMGGAFLEMQTFIASSTEHLIEAKEEKVVEPAGNSDPKDPTRDTP